MPFPDLPADAVKAKPIIDGLEKKVAALIELLAVVIQLSVGMEWDQDSLCLIVLFVFFCLQPGLFPGPSHYTIPVSAEGLGKLLERVQLADPFGSAFAVCLSEYNKKKKHV